MLSKRLFDYDSVSGMTTWFQYDPVTKTSYLSYEQDCQEDLDINTRMANDTDHTKQGIKRDWWHYAHIPDAICVKLLYEEGINVWAGDPEHTRRAFQYVNDRDNNKLKVTAGYHLPKA